MKTTDTATIVLAALVGAVAGALAMFILDPDSGRRRRALARDKAARLTHEATDAVQSRARDLSNRARGLAHEAAGAVSNVMPWTGVERRAKPRSNGGEAPPGGSGGTQ